MADKIELEINAEDLARRITSLPSLTRDEVIRGMGVIVGKVEERVIRNIRAMLSGGHSSAREQHIHLEDSVLGVVETSGDIVIGRVSVDESGEVPYARILEEGGQISAHLIKPKSAGAISFGEGTLKSPLQMPENRGEFGDLALAYVRHPGARIAAYHYMLDALESIQGEIGGDLGGAWRRVIMRASL